MNTWDNMDVGVCNKDCTNCKSLNVRTDGQGYPFAWECMKFNLKQELKPSIFGDSKEHTGTQEVGFANR